MSAKAKFAKKTYVAPDEMLPLPTFWDSVISIVGGTLAALGVLTLATQFTVWLTNAALVLTGWAAFAYAIWIVFSVLSIAAALYTSSFVVGYLANRNPVQDIKQFNEWTSNKVRGWFGKSQPSSTVH